MPVDHTCDANGRSDVIAMLVDDVVLERVAGEQPVVRRVAVGVARLRADVEAVLVHLDEHPRGAVLMSTTRNNHMSCSCIIFSLVTKVICHLGNHVCDELSYKQRNKRLISLYAL